MFEQELPYGESDTSEAFLPLTAVACSRLNLLAATKAKEANAYDHALSFANAGMPSMFYLSFLNSRILV